MKIYLVTLNCIRSYMCFFYYISQLSHRKIGKKLGIKKNVPSELCVFFINNCIFIIPRVLTSTLVLGKDVMTRPLHPIQVRKRSSSSPYMIETYNTQHRFPCY